MLSAKDLGTSPHLKIRNWDTMKTEWISISLLHSSRLRQPDASCTFINHVLCLYTVEECVAHECRMRAKAASVCSQARSRAVAQWPLGKEVCGQAQGPAREPKHWCRGWGSHTSTTQTGTEGPGAAGQSPEVGRGPRWDQSGPVRPICAIKTLTANFFPSVCSLQEQIHSLR